MSFESFTNKELAIIKAVHTALAAGSCAQGAYPIQLWDAASRGEKRKDSEARQALAISICEGCPVKQLCHQFAEALPETSGVWGGVVYEDPTKRKYQSRKSVDSRQRAARRRLARWAACSHKGGRVASTVG